MSFLSRILEGEGVSLNSTVRLKTNIYFYIILYYLYYYIIILLFILFIFIY